MTVKFKSFISAIFAVIVVFALTLLAYGFFIANSGFENTQLESRLVGERFFDAQHFVSGVQDDAVLDTAYDYACGSVTRVTFCSAYTTKVQSYWTAASGNLTDAGIVLVSANFAGMTPDCPSLDESVNPQTQRRMLTFTVTLPGTLSASSKDASKSAFYTSTRTGEVDRPVSTNDPIDVHVKLYDLTGTVYEKTYNCPGAQGEQGLPAPSGAPLPG